jgi:hypothetical protein
MTESFFIGGVLGILKQALYIVEGQQDNRK